MHIAVLLEHSEEMLDCHYLFPSHSNFSIWSMPFTIGSHQSGHLILLPGQPQSQRIIASTSLKYSSTSAPANLTSANISHFSEQMFLRPMPAASAFLSVLSLTFHQKVGAMAKWRWHNLERTNGSVQRILEEMTMVWCTGMVVLACGQHS
jgi:hypothetical protein